MHLSIEHTARKVWRQGVAGSDIFLLCISEVENQLQRIVGLEPVSKAMEPGWTLTAIPGSRLPKSHGASNSVASCLFVSAFKSDTQKQHSAMQPHEAQQFSCGAPSLEVGAAG
jgi:hypothetical protein